MAKKSFDEIFIQPIPKSIGHSTKVGGKFIQHGAEKHKMGKLLPKKTRKLVRPKLPKPLKGMKKLIPKI